MANNNQEMITMLPEALIILIISFLPLIDAVKFCSLSRRWFGLWNHCKHLDFDETFFIDTKKVNELWSNDEHGEASILKLSGRLRFIDYIDYKLPHFVESDISKFRLHFAYETEYQDHVEAWIAYVISREVKEIILDFSDGAPLEIFRNVHHPLFEIPEFIFEDRSLKVLHLNFCGLNCFNFPGFIGITSLFLRGVFLTESSVHSLVTNCGLLEDLSIVNCSVQGKLKIISRGLNLKKLTIKGCVPLARGIGLFAPNLQYFEYSGLLVTFNIGRLGGFVEVVMDFRFRRSNFCGIKFRRLIQCLDAVTSLKLNDYFIKGLLLIDCSPIKLSLPLVNLSHLTLKTGIQESELPGIFSLLRSTSNIETLTLQLGSSSSSHTLGVHQNMVLMDIQFDEYALAAKKSYMQPPRFPFRNLKTIKLEGFVGLINEMELLAFLLRNTIVLEQVIFSPPSWCTPTELERMRSWAVDHEGLKKLGLVSKRVEIIVYQPVA